MLAFLEQRLEESHGVWSTWEGVSEICEYNDKRNMACRLMTERRS